MYPVLEEYLEQYRYIEPCDLIKFCYQSVMGPGHMAPSCQASAERISKELAESTRRDEKTSVYQMLEGEAARLDIDSGISPESLGALFCLTAKTWPRESSVCRVFEMLEDRRVQSSMPFGHEALLDCIADWRRAGCPAVSHSETYKEHYRAHYRIVMKQYLPYLKAIASIEHLPNPAVVAIDGMCGAGKSTLADVLGYVFDAEIVHMDDFFLPFEMKTKERLAEAGGNIHYERFIAEAANMIKSGEAFSYGVYDCAEGRVMGRQCIKPSKIVIVEGSYSINPHIPDIYDLKIFVETDKEKQLSRIENRSGNDMLEKFKSVWIPLEERYFQTFNVRNKCDIIVRT
ncbi:MAG: hypothetical protein VB078_11290 [Clostridiaceae bacterium]|nr:hypothetical protein [Clostridiaceae bacterium]